MPPCGADYAGPSSIEVTTWSSSSGTWRQANIPRSTALLVFEHGKTGFLVSNELEMAEAIEAAGTISGETSLSIGAAYHGE
jgi:hypothetical protein